MIRHTLKILVVTTLILAPSATTLGQAPERVGLEHLMEYLNLRPSDLSFRPDYTAPDSFRLALVSDLMTSPIEMIAYTDSLRRAFIQGQPEVVSQFIFSDLKGERQGDRGMAYRPVGEDLERSYGLYYTHLTVNQLLERASRFLDVVFPRSADMALAPLSEEERRFILDQVPELIITRLEEEQYTQHQLDSLERKEEQIAERFAGFGYRFSPDPIVRAGIACLREFVPEAKSLRSQIAAGNLDPAAMIGGTVTVSGNIDTEQYLGLQSGWRVGGPGTDYYSGDYSFILDLGGNDVYDLSMDPSKPHGVIIIDLSGDDTYRADSDFSLASGCLSVGLLLDFEGNDRYEGRSFSLGSGYFGFGFLYDAAGDDVYTGDTHTQGAGTFGLGLLIDEGGRDIYQAALFAQGFGFVRGLGLILEGSGSDNYYAGGKYKDFLRYSDHYLSMSQGFGYGVRPTLSGGIGAIVDFEGNDNYNTDIFGQGASYWWSLGVLYDLSGRDNYQSFQYAQGSAAHMTLAVLVDDSGDDVYFGKGLMQGVGHDYSAGIILDRAGNDVYTAYDLGQGSGSANGFGILIDDSGDDRYYARNASMTQGYGNPRREFGSVGLFIDLGGTDQYLGNGRDNYYWLAGPKWGGGMDIELNPPDSTEEK